MSQQQQPTPLDFIKQTMRDHAQFLSPAAGHSFQLVASQYVQQLEDEVAQVAALRKELAELAAKRTQPDVMPAVDQD